MSAFYLKTLFFWAIGINKICPKNTIEHNLPQEDTSMVCILGILPENFRNFEFISFVPDGWGQIWRRCGSFVQRQYNLSQKGLFETK
jgi:hypothetical protein